jgi:uncharacterized membrane protein YjjP (DUF1212 family)
LNITDKESNCVTEGIPSLEDIARLCLAVGRMLMEWGANAGTVQGAVVSTAKALGCTAVEVYCQHSAIIVMLRRGEATITHMGKVGLHGINLRRGDAVNAVVDEVVAGRLDCESACQALKKIPHVTPGYPVWVACLFTGLACSAFGRLLNMEWISFIPVLIGAGVGQFLRHHMLMKKNNFFLMVASVGFTAAFIAGLGGRLLGDKHLEITTVAATLLLVPGPAMLNAQVDAIDGMPNLAVGRVFRVMFILLFMTLGLILAQKLIGL